ncbi:MAG: hypothetical protein EOO38_17110, partial [Cytophagaceae bacterium]
MFLTTYPRTSTRTVPLSDDRTGTIDRENLSRNGRHPSLRYRFGTEQQPDALEASSESGWGFYYVRTQVRAAPAVVEIGPFEVQADTYKAMVFGTSRQGQFTSTMLDITPARIPQRDGTTRPPAMKIDEAPIFFCTETAPYLTNFLAVNWVGIDTNEQTSRLVRENAVSGAVMGGLAGAAGAILGLRAGAVKGFVLAGVPGAVGGGMVGGIMGYINGAGLARGKDHDVALGEVLKIFMNVSTSRVE